MADTLHHTKIIQELIDRKCFELQKALADIIPQERYSQSYNDTFKEIKDALDIIKEHSAITILQPNFIELFKSYFYKPYTDFGYQVCDFIPLIRLLIEEYLQIKNEDILSKNKKLKEIQNELEKQKKDFRLNLICPCDTHPQIAKKVALSEDPNLLKMYWRFFSQKATSLFSEQPIPPILQKLEFEENRAQEQHIRSFLQRNIEKGYREDLIEANVIKIQRFIRKYIRKARELERMEHNYTKKSYTFYPPFSNIKNTIYSYLNEHKSPYLPRCFNYYYLAYIHHLPIYPKQKEISLRIYNTCKEIKLFTEIKHLTPATNLPSKLNCLFSQLTLKSFGMPFSKAALGPTEHLSSGDGGVICFGSQEIHSSAFQTQTSFFIEICLEAKRNNQPMFCKQKDLGFAMYNKYVEPITIKDYHVSFCTTNCDHKIIIKLSKLHDEKGSETNDLIGYYTNSKPFNLLPELDFFFYNVPQIHQSLICAFFKFLDNLKEGCSEELDPKPSPIKNKLYELLETLTPAELKSFLQELGLKITRTMEINYYGAFMFPFDTLKHLKKINSRSLETLYTLKLEELINQSNTGNRDVFIKAKQELPDIFNSYRLLDYLMTKIKSQPILREFQEMRNSEECLALEPKWMKLARTIRKEKEEQENIKKAALRRMLAKFYPTIGTSVQLLQQLMLVYKMSLELDPKWIQLVKKIKQKKEEQRRLNQSMALKILHERRQKAFMMPQEFAQPILTKMHLATISQLLEWEMIRRTKKKNNVLLSKPRH